MEISPLRMYSKSVVCVILLVLFLVKYGSALRMEGEVEMDFDTQMAYVGRFVFHPNTEGRLDYEIKIPADDCCSELVIFNGDPRQWPLVMEQDHELACIDQWKLTPGIQKTKISLKAGVNKCTDITEHGQTFTYCKGSRHFEHTQQQWYYVTIMNCHRLRNAGLNASYKFHFVNALDGITAEFSADENSNLVVTAVCSILLTIIFCIANIYGMQLAQRKMLHSTYQVWIMALVIHLIGIVTMSCALLIFSLDGYQRPRFQLVGECLTCAGTVIFASMLTLLSKGHTITRLQMQPFDKLKVAIFALVFTAGYTVLYVMQEYSNPQLVRNIYDTPYASGVASLRILGAVWCLYGIYFTVKDHPVKREFYSLFAIFVTLWFIGEPVVILLSNYFLPLYCRAKYVIAVDLSMIVFGHAVFLLLTRPSVTNHYFPFHLYTNKVDFDFFWDMDPRNNYKPSDITFGMFLTSQCEEWSKKAAGHADTKTDKYQERSVDAKNIILVGAKKAADRGDRLVAITSISGNLPHTNLDHYKESLPSNKHLDHYKESQPSNKHLRNNDKIIEADKDLGLINLQNKNDKTTVVRNSQGGKNDVGDALVTMAKQNTLKYEEETSTLPPKPKFYKPAKTVKRKVANNTANAAPHNDKMPTPAKGHQRRPAQIPMSPFLLKVNNWVTEDKTNSNNTDKIKSVAAKKSKHMTPVKELSSIPSVKNVQYPNYSAVVTMPVTKLDVAMPSTSGRNTVQQEAMPHSLPMGESFQRPKERVLQSAVVKPDIKFDVADIPGAVQDYDVFRLPNEVESAVVRPEIKFDVADIPGAVQDYDMYRLPNDVELPDAAVPPLLKFDELTDIPLNTVVDERPEEYKLRDTLAPPTAKRYPGNPAPAGSAKFVRDEMNGRLLSGLMMQYTEEKPQTPRRHIPETGIQRRGRNNCMTKAQRGQRIRQMNNYMEQVQQDECILEMGDILNKEVPNEEDIKDACVQTIKRKNRNPLHKAKKILGIKKKKNRTVVL